ncbi:ceramide glucosyltransferase isoform X2 [Thrips palmi]|uniref:ceramide glucosyltransferase n=1 Tax=Thrips palmi TaxID=161013 RepID=A0A6P8YIP5_THRPL|nr:ceramide glucosyltransferase isoform X2 [Thrips palmi]
MKSSLTECVQALSDQAWISVPLAVALSLQGKPYSEAIGAMWWDTSTFITNIPQYLAIFFLIFWGGIRFLHFTAIVYAKYRLHRKVEKTSAETPPPGISILKPLTGTDPNLYSNLETFFVMDYPNYELLFCIEDEKDEAIPQVKSLIEKYKKVNASLFIGGQQVGINPKINNMQTGYAAAKYDLIMISDAGIRMKDDTLWDMVQHLTDNTGLVHQMPFTCDREGFAATLEKIYFGTAMARMYLAADFMRINCHTGMSTLIRKKLLDDVGGLRSFGVYLAEDFFIAKSITDRNWRIRISSQPALQNSGICQVTSFQARLARWVKLRLAMIPLTTLVEPLSECVILGAASAWACHYLFKWDPLVFYMVHLLIWFLCDFVLLKIIQNGSLPFSKFEFVLGWLFREFMGPFIFVHAIRDPHIQWRSRSYRLLWGGVAEDYTTKKV